jgi:hypothetical protein
MFIRFAAALSLLVLALAPAFADPFNINVSSDESSMVLLTITDMNYPDPKSAFSGSINSGQLISVYINGDNGNNGHIQWKATTADRQKCGSGDVNGLSSGSNVTVGTPSSC